MSPTVFDTLSMSEVEVAVSVLDVEVFVSVDDAVLIVVEAVSIVVDAVVVATSRVEVAVVDVAKAGTSPFLVRIPVAVDVPYQIILLISMFPSLSVP